MEVYRRDFLTALALGTPTSLLMLRGKQTLFDHLCNFLRGTAPESTNQTTYRLPETRLEKKVEKQDAEQEPIREYNDAPDGWYIQYAVNTDERWAKNNLETVLQAGFDASKIYQPNNPEGKRTLIGSYASLQDAVKDSEKFKGISDIVGIVLSTNGQTVWTHTIDFKESEEYVPLKDTRWPNMPAQVHSMIEKLVDKYNKTSDVKLEADWIKALMTAENANYSPTAIGYKLTVVTDDKKRKILVRRKDKKPVAYGMMMLTPQTMKHMKMDIRKWTNAEENTWTGIRYFGQLYKQFGDLELAFAAYNAGPGNVEKYNGVPPLVETRRYVSKVMGNLFNN